MDNVQDHKKRSMSLVTSLEDMRASAHELGQDELFALADSDNSGSISKDEFGHLYKAMVKSAKEEAQRELTLQEETKIATRRATFLKHMLCLALTFLAIQILANAGLSWASALALKDAFVTDAVSMDANGVPIGTAEALVSVPMLLAPVLPLDKLIKVKSISTTYFDTVSNQQVEAHSQIVEVRKYNTTFVEFVTSVPGRNIAILNGEAFILDKAANDNVLDVLSPNSTNAQAQFLPICVADVSCSAFKVEALNIDLYTNLAQIELANSRRMLGNGPWDDYSDCRAACESIQRPPNGPYRDCVKACRPKAPCYSGD